MDVPGSTIAIVLGTWGLLLALTLLRYYRTGENQ